MVPTGNRTSMTFVLRSVGGAQLVEPTGVIDADVVPFDVTVNAEMAGPGGPASPASGMLPASFGLNVAMAVPL